MQLIGLQDNTGAYRNNATVTIESLVSLVTGEAVDNVVVPLSLEYVAASDGDYQGAIPHDADVVVGHSYVATILAVTPSGEQRSWEERIRCKQSRG
jgi:hypothetical protein